MKLAILGIRGIPANYGGFETFAEELSTRLVQRGHEVTVYCRPRYVPRTLTSYKGVRLLHFPTVNHKYLDTVVHTMLSSAHAVAGGYDAVLVCNAANAFCCGWPRVAGTKIALNVDGIERKRRKWNAMGRGWYLVSERMATWFPNAIITDALVIKQYYQEHYGAGSTFIPYGCNIGRHADDAGDSRVTLDQFGLQPDGYFLYVSRLEPENNAHAVIAAYEQTQKTQSALSQPLVVVGDAPYAREYIRSLHEAAGPRVIFTGGVYGQGYRELQSHALAYIHATEVGGTHPALVEAMGFGNCVLVNDVPENREVVSDAGLFFHAHKPETLAALMTDVAQRRDLVEDYRARAIRHARERYSWDSVTDQYEALFRQLVSS